MNEDNLEKKLKRTKFRHSLGSTVNMLGVGTFLVLGVVSLFKWPADSYMILESNTTRVFWFFICYWCIALILKLQDSYDKELRAIKELVEYNKAMRR